MLKNRFSRACATTIAFSITLITLMATAGVTALPAAAADPPITQRAATGVTADALPTAQINGVVWDQVIVGNTVYAGGQFTSARPPGSNAGTNESPRTNLMSYNLSTGALNSFAPSLNGVVNVLALSPDKSRLYVGGSFTSASGTQHNRIAAYDTATGQVINTFAPNLDAKVLAITATNSAVYVGGWFSTANGNARSRLAAFNPTNGALLGWAPTADFDVNTLLLTPDGSKVIVGGAFATINGSTAPGLGAVDPTSGALIPWIANTVVKNYGTRAAQLSLKTDGTTIYGAGYWFGGTGNFEGVWAADQVTGAIKWLADCHGDTYDSTPMNGVIYSVSHHHTCQNIASFPEQNPRQHWRADAFTADVKGTVRPNNQSGYANFAGYNSPSQVNWFPDLAAGTFTGQTQAAWTAESDGEYVVLGGEFPRVNNTVQQGLVRFAVPSKAPNLQGNRISSASSAPTLKAFAGAVKVSWPTNWDRDDALLTYQVRRSDMGSTPLHTVTNAESLWWNRRTLSFIDTTVAPNTSYTYTIRVNDPDGNVAFSASVPVTTGADAFVESAYSQQVRADGAGNYWKLNDPAGSNPSTDWAGTSDLTLYGGVTLGAAGAIIGSSDTAGGFSGTTTGFGATATAISAPNVFSAEAWIKTTSTAGGKFLGFGNAKTNASSTYDRHLYMDNTGRISFGVYSGAAKTVRTPAAYNDGQWHQVVATLSAAGMVLYVDGNKVGSDPSVTSGQTYAGYWRLGDNLGGWPNVGTSHYLAGNIDDVAIYPTALALAQVRDHYTKSGRSLTNNALPTAAFTSSCAEGACTFDASGSTDSDGTISSYSWAFGDGGSATGPMASHTYTSSGAYQVALTVTDNEGGTNTLTKTVNVTVPAPNQLPSADFTFSCEERVCSFDGSTSVDTDGTISTYAWTFGDGSTASTVTADHTFAANDDYDVKLTVTDNRNGSASKTKEVHAFNNAAPTADFEVTCTGLTCNVDATGSDDPDGTIDSYEWDFGDTTSGTGVTKSRTYTTAGTYTIELTVTDNAGATDVESHTVTVAAAQNQKPTAAFSSSANDLALAFDGSGTVDTDGTITGYAWTFGDGSTGSGQTASHNYAGSGWFSVTLTVTDNDGATDSITKQVKAGQPILAADGYARTTTSSWGTADTGGAWTLSGSATRMSTDGSTGRIRLEAPGVGTTALLNSVSSTNFNVVSDVSVDKLGTGTGGISAGQILRRQSGGEYRVKLRFATNGALFVSASRIVAGTETTIREVQVSGLTYAPGDVIRFRANVSGTGTTSLTGKVWKAGTAEPAANHLTTTDATAVLQSAGTYGIQGYLAGSSTNAPVVLTMDNLLITAN